MSIGAYILINTGSKTYEGLPADLECVVTEIRVEQHLNRRCSFAFRLQEDFEDGEGAAIEAEDLRGSKGVAILVSSGPGQTPSDGARSGVGLHAEQLMCLICGQIENSRAEVTAGGSGSWYEVSGRDLRTLAARERVGQREPGGVDVIAKKLSETFTTGSFYGGGAVAEFPDDQPYVFGGTKLDGLEQLSNLLDYPLWLTYRIESADTRLNDRGRQTFEITVDTHFQPSPARGENDDADAGELDLALANSGNTAAYLRIIGNEKVCENVLNFTINSDNEAYSCVSASVVDPDTGEAVDIADQASSQPPLIEGEDIDTTGAEGCERKLLLNKPGNPDIVAAAAQAAANEASWYVHASALTTVHMLGTVLQPHDLVEVLGGGCGINGVFQVEHVTHVINAAGHWMHLDLRSNSRSLQPVEEGAMDDA